MPRWMPSATRGASLLRSCASPRCLARNCSRASRNQRVVDGHDLIDCPGPKPFADIGCCQTDATGRKRRLHPRSAGLRMKNSRRNASRFFQELAAVIGVPGDSASKKIALIVGEEGLEAALHFCCSTRVAQIVHLQILCCEVVQAQHVAEAKW
eukprot:1668340-Pleurochrysis_carterae.AAC.1